MKTCKNPTTRVMRVLKVGTALGVAIFGTSALEAQNYPYNPVEPSGVTLPSGQSQPAGLALPLGATQAWAPLAVYPSSLPMETPPELRATSTREVKEVLKEAARGNQTEIALADMVEARSQNPGVKRLADSVRIDEASNNGRLKSLAQEYGVDLGTFLGWMNHREIDRLQRASGAEFDKEYTKMILEHDVKCINHFEKAAQEITEPDVATFAVVNLPRLRNQVRRSEYAARSVGVDEGTISSILNALPSEDQGIAFNEDVEKKLIASR
jgi:predicted outer membrane protein